MLKQRAEVIEYYGLDGQETLSDDPWQVLHDLFADSAETAGESFDSIADRLAWPVRIFAHKPMEITDFDRQNAADAALDLVLDSLDETYGNPVDASDPTDGMEAAARKFADAVASEYRVWACEPTGRVIEYTREEVRRLVDEPEPTM